MRAIVFVLASCALSSCTADVDWTFRFADSGSAVNARWLVAKIEDAGCGGRVIFETGFRPDGAMAATPPALDSGTFGFRMEALDASCTVIAAHCVALELDDGLRVESVLAPVTPAAPVCAMCSDGRCAGMDAGVDAAIDAGPPLDGQCTGCIDDGRCVEGTALDACGRMGEACARCSCAGDMCVSGDCVPERPATRAEVAAIHACAIVEGRLLCWGTSQVGEVGTTPGGAGDAFPIPRTIGGNSDYTDLSAFGRHTCARRATGAVVCLGSDNYGQLGDGGMCENGRGETPSTFAGIDDIEVGFWHTFALGGGTLFAAGNSANGRLAVPTAPECMFPAPFEIMPAGNWIAAAGGDTHSCAIRSDGTANRLLCAGQSEHGALGVASSDSAMWIEPVPAITDFAKVFAGNSNGCAIRSGGAGMCWGCTTAECAGSIGLGPAGDALPTDVGTDVAEFALWNHGCMRTNSGALACSGPNADGRLGVGDREPRNVFTPVEPGSRWIDVDAGELNTCGVREGGAIYCWGANTFRVLGEMDDALIEDRPHRICVPEA